MKDTIWTADEIRRVKNENGVEKVYHAFKIDPADEENVWYDAIGFEKEGVFWIAKGSIVSPIDLIGLGGCWELTYRVDCADDCTICKRVLTRNENLLTKLSAARLVACSSFVDEGIWTEV